MDKMYFWTIVLFLCIGTFLIRISFLFLYDKLNLSENIKGSFKYIPMAVLPAIIGPAVIFHQGSVESLAGYERALAFVVASIICYLTKSVIGGILSGMLSLHLIIWIFN